MVVHPPSAGLLRVRLARAVAAGCVLVAAAQMTPPAAAADVDVGVSIGIQRPGVYGRVDIGRYPAPVLVSPRPVVVVQPPVVVHAPQHPIALWVPPAHRYHWRKHCHRYGACEVPVVFVQDRWAFDHGPGGRRYRDDGRWSQDDRRGGEHPRGWAHRSDGQGSWREHERPHRWDRADRRERRRDKDRDDD